MMILVACVGFGLAGILNWPFGGLGTIYSQGYSETGFVSLREGMTMKQVEEIRGRR
jgi:hypothetical protein